MRTSLTMIAAAAILAATVQFAGGAAAEPTPQVGVGTNVGSKVTIPSGARGFDTLGAEGAAQIAYLKAAGYTFDVIDVIGDAWQGEYDAAAGAGMDIVLFQGFDRTTWPDTTQGTSRGTIVAAKATAKGYPAGAQIFLNLEDNTNASAATAVTWVKNWAKAVAAAGYTPGVYVGAPQALAASQLNSTTLTGVKVFWRSASGSAPQAPSGFVVRQGSISSPSCSATSGIDTDVAGTDHAGQGLVGVGFAAQPISPTTAGAMVPVGPNRLLDTRTTHSVGPQSSVTVKVRGAAGVGTNIAAAILNVTVTAPTRPGNIVVYATGSPRPGVSNLNFSPGQTIPNLVTVPVGADGTVTLFNSSPGTVQLIADIQGYYLGGAPTVPGAFRSVTPIRLLDTRNSTAVTANGTVTVAIPGASGVSAAVLNVTVTAPTRPGNIAAYPGTAVPAVSNLNFVAGQTIPNLVTVPVSSPAGTITLRNNSPGTVQLIADLQGEYASGTPTTPGAFQAVSPARLLDTRQTRAVPALGTVDVKAAGNGGIPASGSCAGVLNVTVTAPARPGNISAFPSGNSRPAVSNLNFVARQTIPNLAIVPFGNGTHLGSVSLLNSSPGTAQLIADVQGYFRSGP